MYKKVHTTTTSYFFTTLIILFLIDVLCFSFFEQRIFYLLLCLYCIELMRPHISAVRIASALLLIAFDSFVQFGRFGITLLYLMPLSYSVRKARTTLQATNALVYFFVALCLCAQFALLEPYVLGLKSTGSYMCAKIIINLLALAIIRRL
jgi:hypothetical protein